MVCSHCVQVTYKDRFSKKGTATEAEWKPIERSTRQVPAMDAGPTGMRTVMVNATTAHGVLFMKRPPFLLREPPREDLVEGDDAKMEHICDRVCKVHADDLSSDSKAFWHALASLHRIGRRAAAVPSLPCTPEGHSFTFTGCPQPLLPLLKDLAFRFERPLITWDVFGDVPPPEFCDPSLAPAPAPPALQLAASGPMLPAAVPWPQSAKAAASHNSSTDSTLRDPRIANTVSHIAYKRAEQTKDAAQLTLEDWRSTFAGRVECVASDRLYIVRLDEPDGEFKLGLVTSTGEPFDRDALTDEGVTETVPHMRALWFGRKGAGFGWGKNPAFEPYGGTGPKRIANDLPVESFLVEVTDDDLTEAGLASKWTEPKLKETFTNDKLRWIAEKYGLLVEEPNRERPKRKRA